MNYETFKFDYLPNIIEAVGIEAKEHQVSRLAAGLWQDMGVIFGNHTNAGPAMNQETELEKNLKKQVQALEQDLILTTAALQLRVAKEFRTYPERISMDVKHGGMVEVRVK